MAQFMQIIPVIVMLFPALIGSHSQTPNKITAIQPIRFEHGAICARVRGQLPVGQDSATYILQARDGQHMVVNLAPNGTGNEFANVGEVTTPSGKQDGGKGGIVYDAKLTENGEYRIRVGRNLMATQGGKASFVLEVVVY